MTRVVVVVVIHLQVLCASKVFPKALDDTGEVSSLSGALTVFLQSFI